MAPVTGCPGDVCTVAPALQGNGVKIKAITRTGTLYHPPCGTNGRDVNCDAPWAPVRPQPGAVPPPAAGTLSRGPGPE